MFNDTYNGCRVLVTGHTGFKGSWLSLWLTKLGAHVIGYSLDPPTIPNHFEFLNLNMVSIKGDIRDRDKLYDALIRYKPEIVFHLAAQSLVRRSYMDPIETFETNIIGTMNILETCRTVDSIKAIVIVTSDKCYENREWVWPYRENDALGGSDPYSCSKACSELLVASYRDSFLKDKIPVATVRAGNVIGGGDWAQDRLIPDIIRSITTKTTLKIRYPNAVRPWQHVLEPLCGYLMLGAKLLEKGDVFTGAWNFGPDKYSIKPVNWILNYFKNYFNEMNWEVVDELDLKESSILKLDSSKAYFELGWRPIWDIEHALYKTAEWYKGFFEDKDIKQLSLNQLEEYESGLKEQYGTI